MGMVKLLLDLVCRSARGSSDQPSFEAPRRGEQCASGVRGIVALQPVHVRRRDSRELRSARLRRHPLDPQMPHDRYVSLSLSFARWVHLINYIFLNLEQIVHISYPFN